MKDNAVSDNPYETAFWSKAPEGIFRPGGKQLTKRLMELARLEAGASILDLGCGLGHAVAYLEESGFRAQGIDKSEKLITLGKAQYPNLIVQKAAGEALPFEAACFDAVLAECSLSVMDTGQAIAECSRVLKHKGSLLISDLYETQSNGASCLLRQEQWRSLLQENGLTILHFEDVSKALTEFCIWAVWEEGSINAAFPCFNRCDMGKPGYFLALAVKQ